MSLLSLFKNTMQKQDIPDDADSGEYRAKTEGDTKPPRGSGKRKSSGANSRVNAVDPVLPEKKRARRRLIGAIALVLAAVIGLPMLLDAEPKLIADDISIQIPSKDKSLSLPEKTDMEQALVSTAARSKTKLVDAEPAEEIIAPDAHTPLMQPENAVQLNTQPEKKGYDSGTEPLAASKLAVATAEKMSLKASPRAKEEVVGKVQNKAEVEDAARALAILDGKSPAKSVTSKADKTHTGYLVQVVALATQDKANALQNTLKAAGIKSYTQKVITVSGTVIRVRVGPFESKGEAEKMRAKLLKIGQSGSLILD